MTSSPHSWAHWLTMRPPVQSWPPSTRAHSSVTYSAACGIGTGVSSSASVSLSETLP